jgi:hypothetical protein
MWSKISSRASSPSWASGRCTSSRRVARATCRRSGPNTRLLLAQPFLSETVRALQARGATLLQSPYPFGVQGTTRGSARRPRRSMSRRTLIDATRAPAERAVRALARYREKLEGKRLFFFPDSQLEIPLARFLHEECGMELRGSRHAVPRQAAGGRRTAALPGTITLSEGQDVEKQLDRCRAARPDLTVCGLGLANPLEAEGLRTKWSIELVFSPIHGYEQAATSRNSSRGRSIAHSDSRSKGGAVMQLTLWTYEGPPHVGAMRIATSMEGVHYVLHAPQGDTYADLLFTMIERRDRVRPSRTPRSRRATWAATRRSW